MRNVTAAKKIFDIEDDFELCNKVFGSFANLCNKIDVASYEELERVVTLVWHSFGLIGNGGFHFLFEGDYAGDEGFVYTVAAYHRIGALTAYRAFQDAFRAFPRGALSADIDERLRLYESKPKRIWDGIERRFYGAEKEIVSNLAKFIRDNRHGFEQLLEQKLATQRTQRGSARRRRRAE